MASNSISFQIRAKNSTIFRYMREHNLTHEEMAKRVGISKATLFALLHFRWSPSCHYKTGRRNYSKQRTVDKLEQFFGCSIEGIISEAIVRQIDTNQQVRDLLQNEQVVEKEIDLEFLPFHALPEIAYTPEYPDIGEQNVVRTLLHTLKPQERKVLEMRFGIPDGETFNLEETGKALNVCRERVRQIESRALMKLKHISRRGLLKKIAPPSPPQYSKCCNAVIQVRDGKRVCYLCRKEIPVEAKKKKHSFPHP